MAANLLSFVKLHQLWIMKVMNYLIRSFHPVAYLILIEDESSRIVFSNTSRSIFNYRMHWRAEGCKDCNLVKVAGRNNSLKLIDHSDITQRSTHKEHSLWLRNIGVLKHGIINRTDNNSQGPKSQNVAPSWQKMDCLVGWWPKNTINSIYIELTNG